MNKIRIWLNRLQRKINNLVFWLPVVIRDCDWDDYYILEILKNKLKKQAKHIKKFGNHTNVQIDLDKINLCISLIDRIQNDFYIDEFLDYHNYEYNFKPTHSNFYELESKLIWEKFDDYLKKYPLVLKRVLANGDVDVNNKSYICKQVSVINQQRAHKLLYKALSRYINNWWT
jgi:hypothetical protein